MNTSDPTQELESLRLRVRHLERELKRTVANFSRALEQGRAVVYRRNFDARTYEYMSACVDAITGYPAAEMTPAIWDGLVVDAEFKGPLAGLPLDEANHRVRSGQVDRWQADVEIRTRSGETRWVMDLSTVLSDATGHCYGCLGILQDITDRKLAEKEMIRASAALHAQNQELESDLALAAELQAALMPTRLPGFPSRVPPDQCALRFHRRYKPTGAVGGDFFDVLELSETKVGVLICDVMGHGVRSALVTGMIRALMEHLSAEAEDPGLFLARVNHALHAILARAQQPMFATAFYLVADILDGEVRYARAGHPAPLHVRRDGGVEWICPPSDRGAAVLGLLGDSTYPTGIVRVDPGDTLLLFTDGIVEVTNPAEEEYGAQRLIAAAREHATSSAPALLDALMAEAAHFAAGEKFTDDVCLVAVEIAALAKGLPPGTPISGEEGENSGGWRVGEP